MSLNSAREKGRDAQRVAQMKEVEKALLLYYFDHGSYPPGGGNDTGSGDCATTDSCLTDADELVTGGYLPVIPLDPVQGDVALYGYRYYTNPDHSDFTLMFQLETDTNASWCGISTGDGHTSWTATTWYRDISHADCQ